MFNVRLFKIVKIKNMYIKYIDLVYYVTYSKCTFVLYFIIKYNETNIIFENNIHNHNIILMYYRFIGTLGTSELQITMKYLNMYYKQSYFFSFLFRET